MFASAQLVRSALCAAVMSIAAFALLASPARALRPQACPGSTDIPSGPAGADAATDAVVCLVNAERTNHGVAPLKRDANLAQAARRHASDMAQHDFFAHINPSGDSVGDRVRVAGYGDPGDGWKVGEDIGWGSGQKATPAWIVQAWLNSPRHRRILLSDTYVEFGVGVIADTPKATLLAGATYAMDLGVIRP